MSRKANVTFGSLLGGVRETLGGLGWGRGTGRIVLRVLVSRWCARCACRGCVAFSPDGLWCGRGRRGRVEAARARRRKAGRAGLKLRKTFWARVCLRQTEVTGYGNGAVVVHWTRVWRFARVRDLLGQWVFRTLVRFVQTVRTLLLYAWREWTGRLATGLLHATRPGRLQPRVHALRVGARGWDHSLGLGLPALKSGEIATVWKSIGILRTWGQINTSAGVVGATSLGPSTDEGVYQKRASRWVIRAWHLSRIFCRRKEPCLADISCAKHAEYNYR